MNFPTVLCTYFFRIQSASIYHYIVRINLVSIHNMYFEYNKHLSYLLSIHWNFLRVRYMGLIKDWKCKITKWPFFSMFISTGCLRWYPMVAHLVGPHRPWRHMDGKPLSFNTCSRTKSYSLLPRSHRSILPWNQIFYLYKLSSIATIYHWSLFCQPCHSKHLPNTLLS